MKNCTVKIFSPLGDILIIFDDEKIKRIKLLKFKKRKDFYFETDCDKEKVKKVIEEFKNYFEKGDDFFKHTKKLLDFSIITDFQKKVFDELLKIKKGKVKTYSKIAEKLGNVNLRRGVGVALSKNPFPIVIPCHRVLSKNGLGGFTGGINWKINLLKLEGLNL